MHEKGHFGLSVIEHVKDEISPYLSGKNGLLTNPFRFAAITFTLGMASVIGVAFVNGISAYLKDEL
jgi:hypothetical protein